MGDIRDKWIQGCIQRDAELRSPRGPYRRQTSTNKQIQAATARLFFDLLLLALALAFFIAVCITALSSYHGTVQPAGEGRGIQAMIMDVAKVKPPRQPVPLEPDVEQVPPVNPNEVLCDCLEFIEEVAAGERVLGTLCRCDHPERGILWLFEGDAEGLRRLYEYLREGVETYYQDLQQKRWKR